MNVQRRFLALVAGAGVLLGVQPLAYQGTAQAGSEETEEISAKNPLIDCSTNPAYDNKYIASAFKAGGGHVGQSNQMCNACHKSGSPEVGAGDRPVAKYGTALLQNRLSQSLTYSVKFGKKGEWKQVEIKPGAVYRHSYKYSTPNQNRSPVVWVKYEGPDGEEVTRRLALVATPNPRLGAVYFFDRDDQSRQLALWMPGKVVSRR